MVSTNLQLKEIHNLLFESHAGPHIGPDVQDGSHQLLPQATRPHPTVHGDGSQEDIESRDELLQNSQVFLLPGGVEDKKNFTSACMHVTYLLF